MRGLAAKGMDLPEGASVLLAELNYRERNEGMLGVPASVRSSFLVGSETRSAIRGLKYQLETLGVRVAFDWQLEIYVVERIMDEKGKIQWSAL